MCFSLSLGLSFPLLRSPPLHTTYLTPSSNTMSSLPNTICRAPCRTHLFTWHGALPTPRTAKQRCAKITYLNSRSCSSDRALHTNAPFYLPFYHLHINIENRILSLHSSLGFPRDFEIPNSSSQVHKRVMHRRFLALCVANDDYCRLPIRLNKIGKLGDDALFSILGICLTAHVSIAIALSSLGWI